MLEAGISDNANGLLVVKIICTLYPLKMESTNFKTSFITLVCKLGWKYKSISSINNNIFLYKQK